MKEILQTEEVDKAEKEKETATVDVNKEDIVFLSVSFFVVCKNGCAETANRIHKALHEAQTEVEIKELKSKKKDQDHEKELLSKLCQVLKDHNSSYAEGRLKDSVDFCYNEVIRHNLEGASESEKRRLFPFLTPNAEDTSLKELKVPARLYVISMEEFGVEIAAAVSNLKKDGLQSIFKGNSKLQALSDFDIRFGDSDNEIIQVIKKINATMMSLGHALYKGAIYVKPPTAKFTYVLMMNV